MTFLKHDNMYVTYVRTYTLGPGLAYSIETKVHVPYTWILISVKFLPKITLGTDRVNST